MTEVTQSWDVLSTKVEFQGKQIEQLSEDTAKQFVEFRDSTGKQIASLRGDVKNEFDGLKGSLESLAEKLDTNNLARANSSRSNWISLVGTGITAIGISAGLLGTLATLRLTPIENDVKSLKDNQTGIATTLEKITNKLDNFETRAELTERNTRVDADIATKASNHDLDFVVRESTAITSRLQTDVAETKAVNVAQAKDIGDLRVAQAITSTEIAEHRRELDRAIVEIDRRPNQQALGDLKDRLVDLRERSATLSNRVQNLYDKNYATPRQPCLDSGAGCGPSAVTGAVAQPGSSGK